MIVAKLKTALNSIDYANRLTLVYTVALQRNFCHEQCVIVQFYVKKKSTISCNARDCGFNLVWVKVPSQVLSDMLVEAPSENK